MQRMSIVLGLAVLVLLGCSKKDQGGAEVTDEAIGAADAWLSIVDSGQYGTSWDQACEYFRNVVPRSQWEQQAVGVRGPLGKVISRTIDSAKHTTNLPGAPDGEYVVIQYKTSFENKASAIETVTPMRDPDGVFRVSGYYIR